ncbi:hypothetical protein [Clostridium beijerinckii]|uniref:Uncharacterized protein n=1 Tax=Clostridium beijerinckii TaxID=1520 RepID=A0AAX0AV44_CLOBE|nr:hypothetical protein [Clostridium beijerinckii]MBA8934314.1 hypothetical protein [Clostridium beijerinckii]NRT86833.1 hypothetical protein [Clostridium beijerinckii]NRU38505.1 hypothetical protein [Clostridium beijerinckii]NSA98216.1 hypothetical protein [Clostridium beijerinckii]NYC72265.1 hypothetical protein [Clostridium beijerinckii]
MKFHEYSFVVPIDSLLDFLCGFEDLSDAVIDSLPMCHDSIGEEVSDRSGFYGIPHDNFKQLCEVININMNYKWLEEKYYFTKRGQGNVLIFYSPLNKDEFILLDIYCGPTDQNDMIKLGVRCSSNHNEIVNHLMHYIHEEAYPKSSFIEYENNELLSLTKQENYPKPKIVITGIENKWEYEQVVEFYNL